MRMMRRRVLQCSALLAAVGLAAGCASGPLGARPEAQDLSHEGPGDASDQVTLTFDLRDEDLTTCSVLVECSTDGGGTWRAATVRNSLVGSVAGGRITGIRPTADFSRVTIVWDSWEDDVGRTAPASGVLVRVTPSDADGEGVPEASAPFTVDNYIAVMRLPETSITFNYGLGNPTPPAGQAVDIQNVGPGGTTVNWSASIPAGAQGWLSGSPATGTEADDYTLSVDVATLGAGTLTTKVTVQDPAAHDGLQEVMVSLVIAAPVLQVAEAAGVTFDDAVQGVVSASDQKINISNPGPAGTVLSWNVFVLSHGPKATGWLTVTPPATGTTAAGAPASEVWLSADSLAAPALAVDTYTAVVRVEDPNAQGSPLDIPVTLVVNALEAELFLHTGDESTPAPPLDFICVEDGTNPTPDSFWVMNAGEVGSVLQWAAVDNLTTPDWLVGFDGATSGELGEGASEEVTVAVDAAGLDPGDYSAVVTVSGTEKSTGEPARGGDKTVAVSLHVMKRAEINCADSLSFSCYLGEGDPDDQILTITNAGDSALNWVTNDASLPAWLSATPSGTALAGETNDVTVSIDASGFSTPDTHEADIIITGTDGTDGEAATGSPKTVHVTLIIRDDTPVLWHLDIPIAGTWGGHTGVFYTDTHKAATFGDATAIINFMEITYTDSCAWGRNYDTIGLIHTSSAVDRTSNYTGRIGAGQIGRNTGGYPDVMIFYARYNFDTSVFDVSTPGVGTYEHHDRALLTFGPGKPLYARCWYQRGDGGKIPVVSDIRILVDVTCVRMPGAVMESLIPGVGTNTLQWRPSPATEAAAQKLYRATLPDGPWTLIASFADNTTSQYVDSDVSVGTDYYYRVVAETAGGLPGADSNIIPDVVTGLVAHWEFEEGGGQTVADSSGNGNDGTRGADANPGTDDPTWIAGKVGVNALGFDGSDDYVGIPYAAELAPTGQLTFAAWAYRGDWTSYSADARIMCKVESGGYRLGMNDSVFIGVGNIGVMVRRKGTYGVATVPLSSVPAGWHHFAGTYDGRYTSFYIDGALVDTDDAGAGYAIQYMFSNSLMIGAESFTGSVPMDGYYFDGQIDDVRIYSRALILSEIQALAGM